jgi:hypothetical protein
MAENQPPTWESEYPGTTKSLVCLRAAVIHAEQIANQSREAFHHFNQRLAATLAPMHNWPARVLQRFFALKRAHALDNRHLTIAIRALHNAFTQTAKAKPTSEAEAKPVYIPQKPRGLQTIGIKVEDGEIISNVSPDAATFLKHGIWERFSMVTRQFEFKDAIIPESYAWILTHDGVTSAPGDFISVTYSPDEFERLCRLEIHTQSEHLLDGGIRLRHQVHPYSPELLKEMKQREEDQKKAQEKARHPRTVD